VTPVTLSLPTTLLKRFRELASEMLCLPVDVYDGASGPNRYARRAHFHEALRRAVEEALLVHASLSPIEEPPATLVPCFTVHSAVEDAAADFVAQLARASGLTLEQCWHRLVLEFCERSEAPGLSCPSAERWAA
jgi:hypothetical protein